MEISFITVDSVSKKSSPEALPIENYYMTWSIMNIFCGWIGLVGLLCSFPALILSCRVAYLNNSNSKKKDPETLECYSNCAKYLNVAATSTYVCILSTLIILTFFVLLHLYRYHEY